MDKHDIALVLIAALNALTAYLALRTRQSQKAAETVITKLEKNTNSIKDALVASTAKASYAEGSEVARKEAEAKADALLNGDKK